MSFSQLRATRGSATVRRDAGTGYIRRMSNPGIEILHERCTGCGLCVKACPFGAITIRDRKAVVDLDACTLCGACASICRRQSAVRISAPERAAAAAPADGEIWVFAERDMKTGAPVPVTLELLGLAADLAARRKTRTGAVLVGADPTTAAATLIAYGADRVYAVRHRALEQYDDQRCAAVLTRLIREHQPQILLGGATAVGRALLPRVAVLTHTGLTADCTELSIDPDTGLLLQTRPAFGGNILATITCEQRRPQMATVRPAVLPRRAPDPDRTGEIVACVPADSDLDSDVDWIDYRPRAGHDLDLRRAEIIVSAGYGCGGPDGVRLVAELADALGAALAATRAVVDAGWLPYPHQVGQTGTTVQPKLYVACGISGAVQHLVGMQNSDTIVAVNRDADAPIFEHADYAVVGDLFDIVPEWCRQLHADTGARAQSMKTHLD